MVTQARKQQFRALLPFLTAVIVVMFGALLGSVSQAMAGATAPNPCAGVHPLNYVAPARAGAISLVLHREGSRLVLLDGGIEAASREISCTSDASIGGPDQTDTSLTVDYAAGPIAVPIDYHPGALGPNTDNLLSLQGASFAEERHTITGAHSGVITLDGAPIRYSNLTPISDTTPATNFTLDLSAVASFPVNIVDGPVVGGFQTIQIDSGAANAFELMQIANKTNVTINNSSNNAESFKVNIPTASTGLATLTINGGTNDGLIVNLQATPASVTTSLVGHSNTTVNIGASGSVQGIQGTVSIANPPSLNTINTDDFADTTARVVTFSLFGSGISAKINGLAPADININNNDTGRLTINGGSGGNTFTVTGTSDLYALTLNSGTGNDHVNVQQTGNNTLSIHGQAGQDAVVIGSLAPLATGGNVAGIAGTVNVDNSLGFTDLTVDDSGDLNGRTATVTSTQIAGLATGVINYVGDSDLSSLNVHGGTGSDTFTVTPWAQSFLPSFSVSITGGLPIPPASPGDSLTIDLSGGAAGTALSATLGASGYSGGYTFTNRNAVNFSGIETLSPGYQTVTFDKNTGTTDASPTSKTATYGGNVGTLPTAPTKTGYTFASWNTQAGGGGSAFTATTAVTADLTVYAQWTINTYTVTFDKNTGTTDASPTSKTATYGGNVGTLPTAPTKTGYTFASWNTQAGGGGSAFTATTAVTADLTVYAQWTINTYTVGGTASGLGSGKSVLLQNNAGDNLTVSSNAGFTFAATINYGSTYAVTVLTQPTGQTCVVSSGTGTANANVTNVSVTCFDTTTTGSTTGGQVTAGITGGSCAGYQSGSTSFSAPVNPPAGQVFPYGVFAFTAVSCGTGGTVTITLTYPNNLPSGTKYWKSISGSWVDWTSHVTISGKTVVLTLTDGAYGDTNPNPGEISDPAGPAYDPIAMSAGIPTLSEWGLIILAGLMVLFGMVQLPRVRRR